MGGLDHRALRVPDRRVGVRVRRRGGASAVGLIFLARLIPAALAPPSPECSATATRESAFSLHQRHEDRAVVRAPRSQHSRTRRLDRLRTRDRRNDRDTPSLGTGGAHTQPRADARGAHRGERSRKRHREHRLVRRPGARRPPARSGQHRNRIRDHRVAQSSVSTGFLLLIRIDAPNVHTESSKRPRSPPSASPASLRSADIHRFE